MGAVVVKHAPVTAAMSPSQIQSSLNCKIIGVVPPDPDLCVLALNTGSPARFLNLRATSPWPCRNLPPDSQRIK